MTKPASTPILAVISTLPVILGCALLGATEARADYVVTLDQEGPDVVARSNGGAFNLTNATPGFPIGLPQVGAVLAPSAGVLTFGSIGTLQGIAITGPDSFGPSGPTIPNGTPVEGPILGINASLNSLFIPANYTPAVSVASFPTTLDALGLTVGASDTWTWGTGLTNPNTNQSFTIEVVPGPIVGAGLPGLIAALGGLVAMARRRRKQLA